MEDLNQLLKERGKTHGDFSKNAELSQTLKEIFREYYDNLCMEHREVFDAYAVKMSRILTGQATFADHWVDMRGYSDLALRAPPVSHEKTHKDNESTPPSGLPSHLRIF